LFFCAFPFPADPMAYIRTIWNEGSRYGIVKIIPPPGWTGSNVSIVPDHLTFTTRLQDVHKLRHRHRGVSDQFLSYVEQNYHASPVSQARERDLSVLPFPPTIARFGAVTERSRTSRFSSAVDLYQLYFAVYRLDGYTACCEKEAWVGIAADMGLPREDCGRYADVLEDIYVTYLGCLPVASEVLREFAPPPPGAAIPFWSGAEGGRHRRPEGNGGFESVKREVCVVGCHECHERFTRDEDNILTCISCGTSWHDECYGGKRDPGKREFVCEFDSDVCSYGFAQEGKFTVEQYRSESKEFKASWFQDRVAEAGEPRWQDIESEYWKIVEDPTRAVYVKYGNDLDTKRIGSGFPSESNGWMHDREREGLSPHDAPDPWNLNILPSVCGSLLKYSSHSIKGINVPWLYCGSMFSTFCYHAEDLNMMSINYMHESDSGGGKVWYGASSGPGALAFEAAMRTAVPELFLVQPDLQFELVTMVSPVELVARGATVYRAVQRPGEYILTFPQAFHGGFSLGYNIAEAVNFFTPECFPWMRAAVRRSRARGVEPVFDMPQFILDLGGRLGCHADLTANDVDIVREELEHVATLERKSRLKVSENLFGRFVELHDMRLVGKACSCCGQACHLSILESGIDAKYYCLACVVDRMSEFQMAAFSKLGENTSGSVSKPHRVQFFVPSATLNDLLRRAGEEGEKVRERNATQASGMLPARKRY
jgi:JmjC domain, hydroxylase/ARID/BRIGHT DNA binding domain/jmjN domain